MKTITVQWENELQALKNALISLNMNGYEVWVNHNGFRGKKTFFLRDETGISITGSWSYDRLNHFILGYGKAMETQRNKTIPVLKEAKRFFDHDWKGFNTGALLKSINQLLEQPKKNGFIILMDLGSSYQPTFHEDDNLMFFSTAEAAQEEINSHIGDSEEVGGIYEAYSLDDYKVIPATLDIANDIITCEVDGVSYSMYRSDDDYVATELFLNAINQD